MSLRELEIVFNKELNNLEVKIQTAIFLYEKKWEEDYKHYESELRLKRANNFKSLIAALKAFYLSNNQPSKIEAVEELSAEIIGKSDILIGKIVASEKYKEHFDLYLEKKAEEKGYFKAESDDGEKNKFSRIKENIKCNLFVFDDVLNLTHIDDILSLNSVLSIFK